MSTPDSSLSRRTFVGASAALCGSVLTGLSPFAMGQGKRELAKSAFRALPLGSVKARGWLLRQLELQRDGLTGHAEEVLPATAPNSAWKGGDGEDWEKGPYYVKGLIPLAYTLDDETLKRRAAAWIEPILASQREDGFFGPKRNDDWWPRMVVTYLLRDYHEATNDPRVLPFLTRYYRHMQAHLPERPLSDWGRARAGDEIDTILWLHERTGDEFLLPLCDLLAAQAYPWTDILHRNRFLEFGDDIHPKHNVNVPQALKMPVVYSRRSGDRRDREAYRAGLTHLMRDHGTPFGINAGTEMLSGRSTVSGVETCSIVEYMLSAETVMRILGEARIGDEIEFVAFNGLPAALTKDFRQHVYYTLPNNVANVRGEIGYQDDHGDDRVVAPRSGFPCCCYNLHMGWPKLAQSAWATPEGGGLAALVYVPSEVRFKLADGNQVGVVCETDYPFEETVRLELRLDREAEFPLHLRVPAWCAEPVVLVNGETQRVPKGGRFVVVRRRWKTGDRVELRFPMRIETTPDVNGAVSVRRGPLLYALALTEDWKTVASGPKGFDSFEVTTATSWNYALVPCSLTFAPGSRATNPFETGKPPVSIRARARRVESWKARFDGRLPLDPPVSPVATDAPEETITLVPFGSQMLRIATFPVVGTPSDASRSWKEEFGPGFETRWLGYRGAVAKEGRLHLAFAAKAVAPRAVFADFTYEGEVEVGERGNAGLIFRVTEPSTGPDDYRGYYVGLTADGGGQLMLGRSDNRWVPLATRAIPFERRKSHRVRIEAKGSRLRVWVGDAEAPVIEITDATYTSGALGVRSYADEAHFGPLSARLLA